MNLKYYIKILIIMCIFGVTGCVKNKQIIISKHQQKHIKNITKTLDTAHNINKITNNEIAIIFSSKEIGKWAFNATNSAINYLIYKDNDFKIKVFDIANEDIKSIQKAFTKISQENITKVLALLTYDGASKLSQIIDINKYDVYLPLIHKDILNLHIDSIVYGSIDYFQQFNKLIQYTNGKNVNFYDNSNIGKRLTNSLKKTNINLVYSKEIKNNNAKYSEFINKRNKKLQKSTLFLNTPIVKSSIILSQLQAKEIKIKRILSTQLNYTPFILSLTQKQDRRNLLIANSISNTNAMLEEYNKLLDNDIKYNWVNYSTIIGVQYLLNHTLDNFKPITIKNNQVQYAVKIIKTTNYALKELTKSK